MAKAGKGKGPYHVEEDHTQPDHSQKTEDFPGGDLRWDPAYVPVVKPKSAPGAPFGKGADS